MENNISNTKPFFNTTIPSDWEVKKLGNMGSFSKGKGILKSQLCVEGLPCVRYGELYTTHNFVIREFKSYINEEIASESREIKKGDILFAGSGETIEEIGKSAVYLGDKKAFAGGDIIILSTKQEINAEYLSYALESDFAKKQKRVLGQGNSVVHIYPRDLSILKIPLPPLPEQYTIAYVLNLMYNAIIKNEQLIDQKELRKKWLMQNLLTGKKRLKGFSEKWREYHLGDMFSERNERKTQNLQLLSIGQNGVYPQDESIKKDTSNVDKSKYKRICIGDIGYNTMRMWQGRSALSQHEGIVSPAYTILKAKENADSLYFSYLFKTPKMTNLFWRNSQGLVDDTLNCKYKDFSIIKTFIPKNEEQAAIANVLKRADEEIALLRTKTQKLQKQKKGMMQLLLTGKKRLKVKTTKETEYVDT